MPEWNNRWVEIAAYSDEVLNRARTMRLANPSLSFEQALEQACRNLPTQQFAEALHEWHAVRFAERNYMTGNNSRVPVDLNSIKLRDRALAIVGKGNIQFGEALRQARQELGPEFSESSGTPVDPESVKLLGLANEIADKNPKMQFGEALRQARRERG